MVERPNSHASLFADNVQTMTKVEAEKDCKIVHKDLDTTYKSSHIWEIKLMKKKANMKIGQGTKMECENSQK